ncbi:class F sortase [Nocardioides mangrovicus]|uniref:Class F sortase n=1 Tax=Nocardioides mangrovicus TaxID=2478913 RepID=A0A3L8P2L8_9ACTN|nr:class F sortase [Nocardioides mangrovicus]RLV49093.1 class F sortase [Nocardioides mangrovicus]
MHRSRTFAVVGLIVALVAVGLALAGARTSASATSERHDRSSVSRPEDGTTSASGTASGTDGARPLDAEAVQRAAESTPQPTTTTEEEPQQSAVAAPVELTIPGIDVHTALDRLALEPDGTLEKPPHWQVAGWYAGGPRPGAAGPAVIAGHVDSPGGPAVFARLSELERGDVIRVRSADGTTQVFRVDRTLTASKRDFPTAQVYGPTPDAQLRLITCDGVFGRDGYESNLVVFATLVSR